MYASYFILPERLCGFEPFFDERGDQYMFKRILNCEYEFVSPWWDNVSFNAKDLVSFIDFYQGCIYDTNSVTKRFVCCKMLFNEN